MLIDMERVEFRTRQAMNAESYFQKLVFIALNKVKRKTRVLSYFFRRNSQNMQMSSFLGGLARAEFLKIIFITRFLNCNLSYQALNFLFRNTKSNHSNEIRASSPNFTILFFLVSLNCAQLRNVCFHEYLLILKLSFYSSNYASMAWEFR
jgi:hypothetical protein